MEKLYDKIVDFWDYHSNIIIAVFFIVILAIIISHSSCRMDQIAKCQKKCGDFMIDKCTSSYVVCGKKKKIPLD